MKLFKKKPKGRKEPMTQRQKIVLGSISASVILILIGIIIGDPAIVGNLIVLAVFIIIVPLFMQRYTRYLWVRAVEEQFPNFIRDLADSIRSGTSFKEAISLASRTDYGKLSPEVEKMKNRLSWETPVLRALEIFGKEVKDSKLMTEALNIIREAFLSGGNVAATMDAVARDTVSFKEIEAERRSMVSQHVMIMYAIFLMFLGISIMIIFVMVPMVKTQPQATVGGIGMQFANPCQDVQFFPCNFFSAMGVIFSMPEGIGLYYVALFFTVVLIQGIFSGLIAGQLGENSVVAGSKHALIMAIITISVFFFFAKAGMFPV
jgi:flagellar protein FlaJ